MVEVRENVTPYGIFIRDAINKHCGNLDGEIDVLEENANGTYINVVVSLSGKVIFSFRLELSDLEKGQPGSKWRRDIECALDDYWLQQP